MYLFTYHVIIIVNIFFMILQNVNDLNNIKSQKVEKAFSLGLTVQPYIVIVDNTMLYTVVNDQKHTIFFYGWAYNWSQFGYAFNCRTP